MSASLDALWQSALAHGEQVAAVLRALVTLALGLLLAKLAAAGVRRLVAGHGTAQQALIVRRAVFYGVFGVAAVASLDELGFDLSVLLGAAGILTVAIGFASQTSASNLISGLFLLGERPFVVGDLIRVGSSGTVGEVVDIDLLSVKLRTLDNLLVRVPNETLLKAEITNFTRYPIRRIDTRLRVPADSDLARIRALLLATANGLPQCLDEPRPAVMLLSFGEGGLELELQAWAHRESFGEVTNALREAIAAAFAREGIALAVPQRLLRVVQTSGE